ncbi:MAG: RsmB/NOP family class I SAM-dependent RNA methyltransferase [Simkaniaceae bacterium]|nr:RsmB/NOP family class I SAM-dependent RNA methyltransferase [Simkaniaceae bacterium]
MKPFRKTHFLEILRRYRETNRPLDLILRFYFREHRAIGSKDRREICEKLYYLIRWQGLIDAHLERPITDEMRLERLQSGPLSSEGLAPHVRCSFPKNYFEVLADALGEEKALEFCLISNQEAPLTIRCNPLKITREELQKRLPSELTPHSPYGLRLPKRINFFTLPEFKEGLFEVQDEASQLVADFVDPKPGDHVLDYCAGAGGKTLAFAHKMQGKGQIYIHDVRPNAIDDAKKRLARAGIQLVKPLYKPKFGPVKMDWLLLDVPCSGSGTLRRNPDQKWRFNQATLDELTALQREIFAKAFVTVKPGGKIVYATCSVLPQENENQVAYFCQKYNLKVEKSFASFPEPGQMDGFYAALLIRP